MKTETTPQELDLGQWLNQHPCKYSIPASKWVGDRTLAEAWTDCDKPLLIIELLCCLQLRKAALDIVVSTGTEWLLAAAQRHPENQELTDAATLIRVGMLGDPISIAEQCQQAARYHRYAVRQGRSFYKYESIAVWELVSMLLNPNNMYWAVTHTLENLRQLASYVGEQDRLDALLLERTHQTVSVELVQQAWEKRKQRMLAFQAKLENRQM